MTRNKWSLFGVICWSVDDKTQRSAHLLQRILFKYLSITRLHYTAFASTSPVDSILSAKWSNLCSRAGQMCFEEKEKPHLKHFGNRDNWMLGWARKICLSLNKPDRINKLPPFSTNTQFFCGEHIWIASLLYKIESQTRYHAAGVVVNKTFK